MHARLSRAGQAAAARHRRRRALIRASTSPRARACLAAAAPAPGARLAAAGGAAELAPGVRAHHRAPPPSPPETRPRRALPRGIAHLCGAESRCPAPRLFRRCHRCRCRRHRRSTCSGGRRTTHRSPRLRRCRRQMPAMLAQPGASPRTAARCGVPATRAPPAAATAPTRRSPHAGPPRP
eukprot:266808-Chlamydomonas_euryale.AAC.1